MKKNTLFSILIITGLFGTSAASAMQRTTKLALGATAGVSASGAAAWYYGQDKTVDYKRASHAVLQKMNSAGFEPKSELEKLLHEKYLQYLREELEDEAKQEEKINLTFKKRWSDFQPGKARDNFLMHGEHTAATTPVAAETARWKLAQFVEKQSDARN